MNFRVLSTESVFPVRVTVENEGAVTAVIAFVDYGNNKVYFPSNPELEEKDELKLTVLKSLDYDLEKIPSGNVPADVWAEAQKMSSSDYKNSVQSDYTSFGEG